MAGPTASESPLDHAATTVDPEVTEAFKVLANETRLAILLALWETYDPYAETNRVSFSDLNDLVGVRDPGRFNYHLDQLVGWHIDRSEEGYSLRRAGYSVVQTVLAGSGITSTEHPPSRFPIDCEYCDGPTYVGYRNENLYRICTTCVGSLGMSHEGWTGEAIAEGTGGLLSWYQVDPTGIATRSASAVHDIVFLKWFISTQSAISGLCHSCSGVVDGSIVICSDHAASNDALCATCGRRYRARAIYQCTACKEPFGFKPEWAVIHHPAVANFAYERGVPLCDINDLESLRATFEIAHDAEVDVLAEAPTRLAVSYEIDGGTIEVVIDDAIEVQAVETAPR